MMWCGTLCGGEGCVAEGVEQSQAFQGPLYSFKCILTINLVTFIQNYIYKPNLRTLLDVDIFLFLSFPMNAVFF